ncbi:unnamed protein product [Trichobilharzia regenti]|nr:unnamed protein product [Trichobilharzia regenti]
MSTRNPSPPPDYDGNENQIDMIGDTTYSRRWLFSMLIKFLESVNKETSATWANSEDNSDGDRLDSELEEQLCCLWDLTVNRDVLKFLDEFEIVSIFNNALGDVQKPRLLVMKYSVVQPMVCSHMLIICLVANLLIGAVRLIDVITRDDDSLAEVWCGDQLLKAILIAQHEMNYCLMIRFNSEHIFINFITVKCFPEVLPTFGVYLRKVCEDAPHLIHFTTYYNSLRAIIPIIDVVIASLECMDALSCYLSGK